MIDKKRMPLGAFASWREKTISRKAAKNAKKTTLVKIVRKDG